MSHPTWKGAQANSKPPQNSGSPSPWGLVPDSGTRPGRYSPQLRNLLSLRYLPSPSAPAPPPVPHRSLAVDNIVIYGETTGRLRRGCGVTPARASTVLLATAYTSSGAPKGPDSQVQAGCRSLPDGAGGAGCRAALPPLAEGAILGAWFSARGSARPSGRPAPASAPGTGRRPSTSRRQAPAPSAL
jgi:hypothetical protein